MIECIQAPTEMEVEAISKDISVSEEPAAAEPNDIDALLGSPNKRKAILIEEALTPLTSLALEDLLLFPF